MDTLKKTHAKCFQVPFGQKVLNHLTPLTVIKKGYPTTASKPNVFNATYISLPIRNQHILCIMVL